MKKVVSLIIIISMLFSTLSITAYAEENADISSGFINTVNGKTGQAVSYQGISKNGIIYMLPDDIAAIGEYECKSDYIEREQIESIVNSNSYISKAFSNIDIDKTLTDNRFEYLTFSRNNTTDYITKIFYHDGQATTMNKIFEIEFVNYEGKTYLNLEKMLYLMHAQWHVTDTNLYYYPLGNNIFDFIGMNFNYMYENRVQHNSLLMNGEDKWTHSTRVVISHIFNDIDMRMFVPFFGSDMIQQEWYEEAILQLATLDDSFIDDYGSEQISKHLEGSSFDKIDTYSSAINAAIDETVDIIELFEKSSDTNLNKFSRWNNVSNLDTAQLEVIKRKVSDVADVVNIVEIVEDFNEVKMRSKEWGNDFVRGLDLLSTINGDEYADYGKDIIKVSEDLLDEFVAPTEAAAEDAMFNSYELILDKLLDTTIIGHIESIVTLSNVIIKSNPDYAKKIENADLMNTVHALINVENVFLSEFVDSYHEYMAISDIRNSLEMFLKTSLRNKTYVYHFNCVFNNTSNWEQTEEAIELENDIYKTYALLSELILTRDYDELLYLDETFGSMYSDKDGLFREKMNVTILNNSNISDNVNQSISEQNEMNISAYSQILDKYYTALSENWDRGQLIKEDLCDVIGDDISEVGYTFIDIDNNGISELIIGEVWREYDLYPYGIYDMYTITDCGVVRVCKGEERSCYYLCSDYKIENEGSSRGYIGSTAYYYFDGSEELCLIEGIEHDFSDEDNPKFFYCTSETKWEYGSYFDESNYEKTISRDEARKIYNSYTRISIAYTSFLEYSPSTMIEKL